MADLADGACRLGRAVALSIELPETARGTFEIRLEPDGGSRVAPVQVTSRDVEGKPRGPIVVPPFTPGAYELTVKRVGEPWSCSSFPPLAVPVSQRLIIPWRDPFLARGLVQTSEGTGVAAMTVAAYVHEPEEQVRRHFAPRGEAGKWRCRRDGGEPIVSAPDGGFAVPVDADNDTLIVAGSWDDPRGIDFRSRRGRSSEPVLLKPRRPWRLVARVLDDDDRPVEAVAKLQQDGSNDAWASRVLEGSVRESPCEKDGRIRLGPGIAPSFSLIVDSQEALPSRKRGATPAGGGTIDLGIIRVDRGARLDVDVSDSSGRPVHDALVRAINGSTVEVWREVRTDSAGRAAIQGLAREPRVHLEVRATGFLRESREVGALDGPPVTIQLVSGVPIRGRLTTRDGEPKFGSVDARRDGGSREGGGFTKQDGTFDFAVPPGRIELTGTAIGYGESDPVVIDTTAGLPADDVTVILGDPKSVSGMVMDQVGNPVAGATVSVINDAVFAGAFRPAAHATSVSGHDGRFSIPLAVGQMDVVVARKPGHSPGRSGIMLGEDEIQIRLGPAAALKVLLSGETPPAALLAVKSSAGLTEIVPVGGRSEIVFEDLGPGRVDVALGQGFRRSATLVEGETTTIDMRATGRIHGRVTKGGRRVAAAAVSHAPVTSSEIGGGVSTITDDDGAFVLEPVAPGEHRVLAQASQGRAEASVVVGGEGASTVQLELMDVKLRVSVVDRGTGAAVPGAKILVSPRGAECRGFFESGGTDGSGSWRVQSSDQGCAKALSGADGGALLSLDDAGPHTLEVKAPGFGPWSAPIDLVDGETAARADLTPGGPGNVLVIIESETPGLEGTLYCIQGGESDSRSPAMSGEFCQGFKPGPAEVAFRATGYGAARAAVEVPEREEVTVTLRVERGGDLVLVVPEPPPRVLIVDATGTQWNQPSGLGWPPCRFEAPRDGFWRYACTSLPPGTYSIRLDGKPHGTAVIRPGETTTIR